MLGDWLKGLRKYVALSAAGVLLNAGMSRADDLADLKARLDALEKQNQELKDKLDAPKSDDKMAPYKPEDIKKQIADYLKDNPGAGMPSGVQTGYDRGFYIRSTANPTYTNWKDDGRIPFEMRIGGRIQADGYSYNPTDSRNHLTQVGTGDNTSPSFDVLMIKRARFWLEGNLFDPNLRYRLEMDGNTRGIAALAGGAIPPGIAGAGGTNTGGGGTVATVDHAVRLFQAWVAYDFHGGCANEKGCAPDCPDGTYLYRPTYSLIFGKLKPFFAFEEYMGSGNQQFVEYGMSNWMFDADDDNLLMCAGVQVRALDDRLFFSALMTNGNETQIPSVELDHLPGINVGFWYDFGGTWDPERKRWNLYGDSISDIDYSCKPVLRVGATSNLVPMDRRSQYSVAELTRARAVPGGPGGTTLIGLLNGGNFNPNAAGVGAFAADAFDEYTFETFWAGKWEGFSIYNGWWFRDLDNFRGRRFGNGAGGNFVAAGSPGVTALGNGVNQPILYTSTIGGVNTNSLFPASHGLFDMGMQLQGGYFLIPKKLEVAARWSWIRGESGNINGEGTSRPLNAAEIASFRGSVPAATLATFRVVNGAFNNLQEANEYAVGVNYYFHRQQVKWQTDFSVYNGGNPAAGGQAAAGFVPGVDGWMIRTQIQVGF